MITSTDWNRAVLRPSRQASTTLQGSSQVIGRDLAPAITPVQGSKLPVSTPLLGVQATTRKSPPTRSR